MSDVQTQPTPARPRRAWLLVAIATTVVLVGWKLGSPFPASIGRAEGPSKALAPTVGRAEIVAQARLEPASGLIVVGARPGTRIEKINVAEGDDVHAGAVLALLEGHEAHQIQRTLADAQKKSADFRRRLRRDELKLERESFDRLKPVRLESLRGLVDALKAKPTADDPKGNAVVGMLSAQAVARGRRGTFEIALAKAEMDLKELESSLELLGRRRALEDEAVADNSPESAALDGQIELAKAGQSESEVRAPIAGRVLSIVARPGEISAGPLLYFGDVAAMTAKAEVFETDVLDVTVGAPAAVTILGRGYPGKVVRVGALVGRNKINSLDPTALADRRVAEVVVRLDDPAVASRLVNMQVNVSIRRRAAAAPSQDR